MQFKTLAFLSILSILFFAGCSSEQNTTTNETQEKEIVETNTKSIQLKTIDNKDITIINENDKYIIKEYKDKIVLLNFFATWCPPCKAEIPNLIDLQNKYGNDFTVISVLLENDKSNEEIQEFANDFKINYPVTNSKGNFDLSKAIGPVRSIPTMFMIGKDSTIFQKYVGVVPVEMMEMDIKKLLKK